jgi:hypothetical protein
VSINIGRYLIYPLIKNDIAFMENRPLNTTMNNNAKPRRGYIAFEIDNASRSILATRFPPMFSDFIGHHVTYEFGVSYDTPLPSYNSMEVVGYALDNDGLEALVVAIDGSTDRLDGSTYHITWSLDRSAGFKPVDSNRVIRTSGWTKLPKSINISATAKFF